MPPTQRSRGLAPLLSLSLVLVLVTAGAAQGWWLANVHNGLLALAFTGVGTYVLHQRPGHVEGRLMLATGVVEAVMFAGRQVGHAGTATRLEWWAWAGVWPVPLAIALVTLTVLCFPTGRLPTPRWRPVAYAVVALAGFNTLLSALWPVGYDAAGMAAEHPWATTSPAVVSSLWDVVVLPSFAAFQVLWVVALVARWRTRTASRELAWLLAAASLSTAALVVGMVVAGSPRFGLLATPLVPIAAGLAIVHGQHAAAYSALTWLSRSGADARELPASLAHATAEALHATTAVVWLGSADRLHPVGLWPETGTDPPPSSLPDLSSPGQHVRAVRRGDEVTGAVSVHRPEPLSRAEERLLDDLVRQAALVLDHLSLTRAIAAERRSGHLNDLTEREHSVLELISRGLSNAAICDELHLSIKTVEPVVGTIFAKLGLQADSASNRRVLAALEYVRTAS